MAGRIGRTPLTGQLRRTLAAHGEAERTGVPVEDVLGQAEERRKREVSRRGFLKIAGTATAAGAAFALPGLSAAARAASPSIIVVGAGLAGVRAAHWLYKVKGISTTVYEGNTRAGGRCYSLRNYFANGVTVEHGGALINTDHNTIRSLINNLGLSLDTVNAGSYNGWVDKFWIDGADYAYDAANADWGQVYNAMRSAISVAPWCQTYDNKTAGGVTLDNMTVNEWLDVNVPGGLASRFAKLMQSNAVAEYGLDPDQQSALNLVYLLGWNSRNSLDPLNGADEKYAVRGGNDQVVTRMLDQLPASTVQYGHKLVAVKRNASGSVRCTFAVGAGSYKDVTADRVIMAIPFTTLRDCDLSQSGFSALKLRTINELGLGANAKLHVEVSRRPWIDSGYGGSTYTNMSQFQCGWDDTSAVAPPGGVFCFFPGGRQVTNGWSGAAFGVPTAAQVSSYLAQLEPIHPGVTAAYTGKAYRDFWHANPWSKGAYTCQKVGQYTTLFGAGAVPEGNVHFAGEHTSVEYFGYLNGAVETGERAAKAAVV